MQLVPELAREANRGLNYRIRRGLTYGLQARWWGLLGIAVQKTVANVVLHCEDGADIARLQLEPSICIADVIC